MSLDSEIEKVKIRRQAHREIEAAEEIIEAEELRYAVLHGFIPIIGSFMAITPLIVLLFLYQRIFISPIRLIRIISFAIKVMIWNLIIFWICAKFHWVQWDDLASIYQNHASEWYMRYRLTLIPFLFISIMLWSMVLVLGCLQLILSKCFRNSQGYGFGLLNAHCLFTRLKPSRFFTFLQDGALIAFAIHLIANKKHDQISLGIIAAAISIFVVWILSAVDEKALSY